LVATGGLYAPTIRYNNGIFYVVCTNIFTDDTGRHFRNFIVSTDDIWTSSWSDPVYFDLEGIDPSLFFEDDGRVYVQGCLVIDYAKQPSCVIVQFEIDILTGNKLSEQKEIWSGAAQVDPEGPHTYKKDGYYYLMIAEGGTFQKHMISIARSTNIWGPYSAYDQNPILTAFGSDEEVQHCGHGDLFQDQEGLWWAVVLGVRKTDNRFCLSRETFLTPVSWPVGSWPKIETVRTEMEREDAKVLLFNGKFPSLKLPARIDYVYIRDPVMENYRFSNDGATVKIKSSTSGLSSTNSTCSFIGKLQRNLNSEATVSIALPSALPDGIIAGIAVYKDHLRHAKIFYDVHISAIRLVTTNSVTGHQISTARAIIRGLVAMEFQIRTTQRLYEFLFRVDTRAEWDLIGQLDTLEMTGYDFTGPIIGVFVSGQGECIGTDVTFLDFQCI
jgi:beta-xylosidase